MGPKTRTEDVVAGTDHGLSNVAGPLFPRGARPFAFAAGALLLAIATQVPALRLPALVVVLTLGLMALGLWLRAEARRRRAGRLAGQITEIVAEDAAPCFTTDPTGEIRYRNSAAAARFPPEGLTLAAVLADQIAAPGAVLFRLQTRAESHGSAREDVVTRRGHMRLSVHRVGDEGFLWRLEEFQDRNASLRGADSLSLPMLTANRQGVVLFSNEAMRRLVGCRPRRLDRVFASPVLHSGDEVEVTGADGPVRAILAEVDGMAERREIYLLPVPAGRGDGVGSDFEHVPVPLLGFAPEGLLLRANRAARELLTLAPDTQPMIYDLFDGLGRPVADWLADVAAERSPGGAEVLNARALGPEAFVQMTLRRVSDQGRPWVLAVLQDATALKSLEAKVDQSQKMQAIGQLAGGVAHDFNNLLTAISGHCDLLLLRHDSADGDYADLIQIRQNANRAAALVGQLLAFSRKQTLKPERLDLQELLSDLTHLLNRLMDERVRLRLAHAPDLGPIRADRRKLEQVVMNLAVNARDAMPDGGTIRIETEAVQIDTPAERDGARVPAGAYAVIHVSDTGCGIPPDRLTKIFEPFYTTKKAGEGTGLGLSTAYGIVKQSGGFIFVDSVEGQGTQFHLWFPINETAEPAPAPEAAARAPALMRPGEGTVLLVEDEAPVRAFASRALRLRGYTVLEAESAEEALQALEDPALEVDVFVTDVVMPGMDGPSWVKRALEDRPDVRVIFVSGYAEDALAEMQARVPNSVFLPKPFSLSDLTATVQGQMTH